MFGQVKLLVYLTVAVFASGYLFLSLIRPERLGAVARKLPPMMAAILIAGYLMPNFWCLYALLFILPAALSRTRMDACVVFIVALLGVPEVTQTITLGGLYLMSMDTTRVLALGLLLAVAVKPRPTGAPRGSKFDLPALIVVALAILSHAHGTNWSSMVRIAAFETLGLGVPYYVISRSIRTRADIDRLLLAMVLGAFILSVMSVYEAVKSWPIYLSIDYRLGTLMGYGQSFKMRAGFMRTATSFAESTSYSVFLAIALLAATASRAAFRSRGRYLAAIGVLLVGMLLAQSRGGWIAIAIGIVAYDLYLRNYARLGTRVAVGALAVMLLFFAAQGSARLSEALGVSGAAVGTGDYRVDLFHRGVAEIRKHPFVGNDMAEVSMHLADLRQGEHIIDFVNGYILYGVTMGIPGIFALFAAFASLAIVLLIRRRPARRGEPPDRAGAAVFAVACFFVVNVATSGFGGRPVVFLIVMMAIGSVHYLIGRRTPAGAASLRMPSERPMGLGAAQPA